MSNLWRNRSSFASVIAAEAWVSIVAAFAGALLAYPDQVTELYRIMHATETLPDVARLLLAVAFMAVSIWFAASLVIAMAERKLPGFDAVSSPARTLPFILASLPLIGCGCGHLAAIPRKIDASLALANQQVGSPWTQVAQALKDSLRYKLPLFGYGLIAAGVVVLMLGFARRHRAVPSRIADLAARGEALAAVGIILVLVLVLDSLFYLSPVALPRFIGTFGVAALFVAALGVNCALLTLLSHRFRLPIIPVLIALAMLFSRWDLNDDHAIRTLPAPAEAPAAVTTEFPKWLASRPDLASFPDGYPVYVMSAQGGGIYAAYQTAVVLARLQDRCPQFRDHLFAVSSVSGGSVGAAVFAEALAASPRRETALAQAQWCRKLLVPDRDASKRARLAPGPLETAVESVLLADHLSPLAAGFFFSDFTQRFLPLRIPALDRARALEYSFEESADPSGRAAGLRASLRDSWRPTGSQPALVLNTTDAASGLRYIFAPFAIPSGDVWSSKSVDLYPLWRRDADVRLSTAALASARFPWISPAALVRAAPDPKALEVDKRLVDGGYVDNSGIETALDLIAQLKRVTQTTNGDRSPRPRPPHFALVAVTTSEIPKRESFGMGETLEPVRALLSTRTSRAYLALGRAFQTMGEPQSLANPFGPNLPAVMLSSVRPIPLSNDYYQLPLGWRLSDQTAEIISEQSGRGWDCMPDTRMLQSVQRLSPADCVQTVVAAELSGLVRPAMIKAAIANYRIPAGTPAQPALYRYKPGQPKRTDHENVLKCYERNAHLDLTYVEARSAEAMLNAWDSRRDLTDERVLALMMALTAYNTNDMLPPVQAGGDADLQRWYGPESKGGRKLGNLTSGDAAAYRGRGFLYLSGRENYAAVARGIGIDVATYPDLINNFDISARSMFFWVTEHWWNRLSPFVMRHVPDWVGAWKVMNPKEGAGATQRVTKFLTCIQSNRTVDQ